MNKIFFISVAIGIITTINPANAVIKCIESSALTSCSTAPTVYKNKPDWLAVCNGTDVHGVAVCSSQASTTIGETSTTPTVSTNLSSNKYCKCKMVSPAVSQWITPGKCTNTECFATMTAEQCAQYCGLMCASAVADMYGNGGAVFLSAMFSRLSD